MQRKPLYYFVFPLLVFVAAAIILHYASMSYFTSQAEEHVSDILLSNRGVHEYIQKVLYPAIFEAMNTGYIKKDFYDPEVLSSSYMVRMMQGISNEERKRKGLTPIYYKLAANNPRNPANKADDREAKLIRLFNEDPAVKNYREIVTINSKKYLYYAIPFLRNEQRCMRCHGNPEDAPVGLRRRYPLEGGFHERLGEIRAIESLRVPIDKEGYMSMMLTGSASSGLLAIVMLFFFNKRLRRKVEERTRSLEAEILERKQAELQLKASEENFRTLFDKSADAILLVDATGRILDANHVALERYKYSKEEFVSLTVSELDSPDDRHNVLQRIETMKNKGLATFEARHMTKDGIVIPTEVNARTVLKDGVSLMIATCRDITERKKAEDAIAAEKERLAVTLRSIGDAVIVTDTEGNITLMNRVAEELTGWAGHECLGRPLSETFNIINETTREQCENPVNQVLSRGIIVGLANHTTLIRKDGSEIIIADSAAPIRDNESRIIGVVLVFRDVTAQYKTEAEMQKLQKLESLGLLAGGLAHDFNNLLTTIMGNVGLAKAKIARENKAHDYLSNAEVATERATSLTQQLLTFAKGGAPIKKKACIADVVKESVDFSLHGSNVKCVYIIPEGLCNTEVDTGQISQVFSNLVLNAIHAMPDGGEIHIGFENVVIADNLIPALPGGDYIRITFKDSGTGISNEHLARIFDPYFTTKELGSGLGLATVYSIIKRHEGHITVESKVGKGTVFYIYLPATRATAATKAMTVISVTTGKGKVLIMDDEAMIRDLAENILTSLGYEVGLAEDGEKAIELYKEAMGQKKPFSVVIMDLTVPGSMGGKEAIGKLLEIDPDAKVIVSSGYSTDPIMSEYKKYGFAGVINKPYTITLLSGAIAKALAGPV